MFSLYASEHRSREEFAILVFVEPAALDIKETQPGEPGEREGVDGELPLSRARHLPGAAMPVNISARLSNEPGMADDADTERVTFTIANLRTINSKRLYALVDVEIRVAGLSFRIIGVQIQRGSGGLSVHLPTHRDVNGAWKPVVEMPEELREPLSDAVMEFLVDEGMAKRK
jgi:DNA-binding cell septation regulator SpoVG